MNQTKFCPVQDQVCSNIKICQNPIMPDEEEGFNSLVIYFFFPVLALTAILLVSLSYFSLPSVYLITLYINDLRIDDWSSILSMSTIYIDDPNISQSYNIEVPIICCAHCCSGHLGSALRPN